MIVITRADGSTVVVESFTLRHSNAGVQSDDLIYTLSDANRCLICSDYMFARAHVHG